MLLGRDPERALIDELLGRARSGSAGVLVLVGEPGIGKTALLLDAAGRADGMTVVRAVGVESEAELEFSALFDVCRPLLDRIGELAERQRQALAAALGIGPGEPADRFAVGAATLSLLAAAAEEAPVLVLLDDAQWLDAASLDALLFAARRLRAERVAMVIAARDEAGLDLRPFAAHALAGLDGDAAAALLASRAGRELDPAVAERLRRDSGGNPLALVELPARLTESQLRGAEPLADPLPVGAGVERVFGDRAARLPSEARRALLVAAISSSSRLEAVTEALRLMGLGEGALEPAEDAGLLRLAGGAVAFRHPLVRSAVVQASAPSERRRAHRALADALAGRAPDERAWHLGAAALGPDGDAAEALAEAGRRARARSGWASAALALERSARLTPDPAARGLRLVEAAEAAQVAGRIELTLDLVGEALAADGAGEARGRAARLQSRIELHCGDVGRALDHLVEEAGRLERDDPAAAVALLADAVEAAELRGEPGRALDAAVRAAALARDGPARFAADCALAQALALAGRPAEAREPLDRALGLLEGSEELRASLLALVRGAGAAGRLGRTPEGLELAARAIELARGQGALGPLAHALEASASIAAASGRWSEASGRASEGLDLARESRCAWASARCLELLTRLDAARGEEGRCRARAAEAAEVAARAGIVSARPRTALGLLELGIGRADEAARTLEAIDADHLRMTGPEGAADLVEACSRSGRRAAARAAFERLRPGLPPGFDTRCLGLLAGDDDFEEPLREAIARHPADDGFGLARTRLCLGERLRRAGRRTDARAPLRAACDGFTALAARPWAERAAAELRATGERLGRREAREGEELTPQELQVALQVAEGKTNKQVGAALFLSPKTVDFHLRRVFRKRGVRTRAELIRHFAAER
jgi:DNA-binding CsgD family transcriptional regulator/tetratricopeptide (TPR) repeat protein